MINCEENSEKSTTPKRDVRSGGGADWRVRCSFCGKGSDEVKQLISGLSGVCICNECVNLCQEIITEGQLEATGGPLWEPHPDRTVADLMQDERFIIMAAKRNLIFQVGMDKRIKVFQELDGRNYLFGVGRHGRNIVYRVVDDDELRELDRTLSGEADEERV